MHMFLFVTHCLPILIDTLGGLRTPNQRDLPRVGNMTGRIRSHDLSPFAVVRRVVVPSSYKTFRALLPREGLSNREYVTISIIISLFLFLFYSKRYCHPHHHETTINITLHYKQPMPLMYSHVVVLPLLPCYTGKSHLSDS